MKTNPMRKVQAVYSKLPVERELATIIFFFFFDIVKKGTGSECPV